VCLLTCDSRGILAPTERGFFSGDDPGFESPFPGGTAPERGRCHASAKSVPRFFRRRLISWKFMEGIRTGHRKYSCGPPRSDEAGGRPGFWPIAFRIIDLHPTNADLRGELEGRIEQFGQTIRGLHSEHLNRCLEDVEHARQLRCATGPVRAWLDDYADRLRRCIDEQRRGEADERVNRT
jgi:hypothetical protein